MSYVSNPGGGGSYIKITLCSSEIFKKTFFKVPESPLMGVAQMDFISLNGINSKTTRHFLSYRQQS